MEKDRESFFVDAMAQDGNAADENTNQIFDVDGIVENQGIDVEQVVDANELHEYNGAPIYENAIDEEAHKLQQEFTSEIIGEDQPNRPRGIICPICGSDNIMLQTVQENQGSTTVSKTKSKYKEGGHGIVWWLTIGWWWWIVDLLIWFVAFFPRLILRIFAAPFKRKKGKSKSTTVETTQNIIVYKTICTCQNCAHTWQKVAAPANEKKKYINMKK